MKKFFLILFFLLVTSNSNSQSNYKLYYENLNKAKNFEELDSIIFYQVKATSYAEPLPKDALNLAFNFYKKNNLRKSNDYFCLAFEYGYQIETDLDYKNIPYSIDYDFGFIEKYKNLNNPYSTFINEMYNKNYKKIKKLRKKFIQKIDKLENYKYEVLLQNEYDFQTVRLGILPKKNISDSIQNILNKYLNTGNSYLMLDLLKNNKFPKRTNCRRFNEQTISMLLNHAISAFATKDDAKEFIELLWVQVENGNISPYEYAKAIDHYTSWYENSEYSLLGTSTMASSDFKTFQCISVLYPEKLNELRNKYWLETIEIFCLKTGFKLPQNYTNK